MAYTDTMTHRLTIAAIRTPAGEPITAATHDGNCDHPNCR